MNKIQEMKFIGFLIKNPNIFREFHSSLKPTIFIDQNCRDIYQLLSAVLKQCDAIPSINEAIYILRNHPKAQKGLWTQIELELKIQDLEDIYSIEYTNATRSIVYKFIIERELYQLGDRVKDKGENLSWEDAKGTIRSFISKLTKLESLVDLGENIDHNEEFIFPFSDESVEKIPEVLGGIYDEDVIPTPFPRLNEIIGGGFHKNEISLLVGLPSRGKTTILLNFALYGASQGKVCVYYSLDDSKENALNRIYSNRARVLSKRINLEEFKSRVKENISEKDKYYFIFRSFPRRTLSVSALAADLVKVKAHVRDKLGDNTEIDLVCVDYLDELKLSSGDGDKLRHKLDATTRDLSSLAAQEGIHIATATQSNAKGLHSRILDGSNLSEGFSKMFAPKLCMAICMDTLQYKQGRFMLGIFKNTWGKNLVMDPCEVSWETQYVREVEDAMLVPMVDDEPNDQNEKIKSRSTLTREIAESFLKSVADGMEWG